MLGIFDDRRSSTGFNSGTGPAAQAYPGPGSGTPVFGTPLSCLCSRGLPDQSSPAELVMALACVDVHFLMSPRAIAVADTAAASGFDVVVHSRLEPMAPDRPANEVGSGKVTHVTEMPTAELLSSLLWRRHVPVINTVFPRASGRDRWVVVKGFDGSFFQVFDPERPRQDGLAVADAEMRAALGARGAVCLVVAPRCV